MAFDYFRPTDWGEASRLLAQPGAIAKMGGCDVLTRFRRGKLQSDVVVGLDLLPGAHQLHFDDERVTIGAAVTLADLERSVEFGRRFPTLSRVIATIASPAIRNKATAVGNVAQGWSVGDLVPLLQVCDASLQIVASSGPRTIKVTDYAKLRGTGALSRGELIASLTIDAWSPGFHVAYARYAFRDAFDLPLVAAAVAARIEDGVVRAPRIALAGATPMPTRFEDAESAVDGTSLDSRALRACEAAAERAMSPRDDHHASSDYRRHVALVTLRRALLQLLPTGDRA